MRSIFGEHDDARFGPSRRQISKVLSRLRHHALVGRDDHQHDVDPAVRGKHVPHKSLMPRNVHAAYFEIPQLKFGKTQSIVIRSCFSSGRRSASIPVNAKRARLPVIDVPSGADDKVHEK